MKLLSCHSELAKNLWNYSGQKLEMPRTLGMTILFFTLAGSVWAELPAVQTAINEGLPVESVKTLIAEGQAKQVPAAELDAAVQRRLASLRSAKAMLQETGYGKCPAAQQRELTVAVANALESKVTTDALRETLKAGGGSRVMRLQAAVEAGEAIKLLGVDDATVAALMRDFVTRNLGRGEIVRAVQFVSQQHRAGVAGQQIRESLWKKTTTNK
jgi:hypothetical protein